MALPTIAIVGRSEERRVGKEGRSRQVNALQSDCR